MGLILNITDTEEFYKQNLDIIDNNDLSKTINCVMSKKEVEKIYELKDINERNLTSTQSLEINKDCRKIILKDEDIKDLSEFDIDKIIALFIQDMMNKMGKQLTETQTKKRQKKT